jgi:hypothetical protein
MTIRKQFAQEGVALDDCLDQLVEVLARLLDEAPNPPAPPENNPASVTAIADLRSGNDRAIHVVEKK